MLTETDFQQAIAADPGDVLRWLLWADWLEENGASDEAEVIRLRSELTRAIEVTDRDLKEARLRELVYERQVPPPVVTMTTSIGLVLHLIPPGQFLMGSPESEEGRFHDENQVPVTLTQAFWMGKFPVTQNQYESLIGAIPTHYSEGLEDSGSERPIGYLSDQEVLGFCEQLTKHEHRFSKFASTWQFTLPSEAQWEYACRAGNSGIYYYGDDGQQLANYAWYDGNAERQTHPVGEKRPNAWGLHDLHGNVWEWCSDWYDYTLTGGTDPTGPKIGRMRACRGGSFQSPVRRIRSADRYKCTTRHEFRFTGFRIVLALHHT